MIAQTTKIMVVLLFAGALVSAGGFLKRGWNNFQRLFTTASNKKNRGFSDEINDEIDSKKKNFSLKYENSMNDAIILGGDISDVNGRYIKRGLYNGKPQYSKQDDISKSTLGETYEYTVDWSSSNNKWYVAHKNSLGKVYKFYYYVKSMKNSEFPPTDGWKEALDVNHYVWEAGTGHLYEDTNVTPIQCLNDNSEKQTPSQGEIEPEKELKFDAIIVEDAGVEDLNGSYRYVNRKYPYLKKETNYSGTILNEIPIIYWKSDAQYWSLKKGSITYYRTKGNSAKGKIPPTTGWKNANSFNIQAIPSFRYKQFGKRTGKFTRI